MKTKHTESVELVEASVKALVLGNNISPSALMIGVHNACAHGSLWPSANFGKKDIYLGQMFDGFEKSIEGAKKVKMRA